MTRPRSKACKITAARWTSIALKDGLEKVGRKEVRQFPQKHVWSSTIWCTRRGDCFRRFCRASRPTTPDHSETPDDMLPFTNATIRSLWSYFARAVEWADASDLKLVWTLLVPDDLVRLLKQLKREGNSALGGTLTDLHQIVSERLPPESLFHDELTWEKLRFARACVVATMRP